LTFGIKVLFKEKGKRATGEGRKAKKERGESGENG